MPIDNESESPIPNTVPSLITPRRQVFNIPFVQGCSPSVVNVRPRVNVEPTGFFDSCSLSPVMCGATALSPTTSHNYDGYEELECYYVYFSPNGTKFWRPKVDDSLIPVEGAVFNSWVDVENMYYKYAEVSGFCVRKGQNKQWKGLPTHKYLRCNKACTPQNKRSFDSMCESSMYVRQKSFTVTDCGAHVSIKISRDQTKFVEDHNHALVDICNRHLTKTSRKLNFTTKQFIHQMSLNRIGPTVAHRLLVSIKGGHHNVRGTPIDFKNFYQGMRIVIGHRDSQLVIDRLKNRYESCPEFHFDFTVENGKLRSVFWADEISKLNYKVFGDVVAFDATYQTNRYKMIFIPFTGVVHHKKCVTFGAALISSETIQFYKWLLQSFLNCHGVQPKLVLSDHDPAMRQAILQVLPESRHRVLTLHMFLFVLIHVSSNIVDNTNIRSRIHRLVWNVFITLETFESRWKYLLEKFMLQDHEWLNEMFVIRDQWVPAYFRDIPMCCLMKTTSRCESSNASLKINSTSANTLVQFMLCFEARLDAQRYSQRGAVYKTMNVAFQDFSGLAIERHAFQLYTETIFKEVRKEIMKAKLCCYITKEDHSDGKIVYSVSYLDKRNELTNVFLVSLDPEDNSASCSCMGFTRIGYLCRHVFCVFCVRKVECIPLQYINERWKKIVLPETVFSIANRYGVDNSPQSVLRNEIFEKVCECVDSLRGDEECLKSFLVQVKSIAYGMTKEHADSYATDPFDNEIDMEDLIGKVSDQFVSIENPESVRTKGCGKVRRIIGEVEINMEKSTKPLRLCRSCGEYVNHDTHNCPLNKKKMKKNKGQVIVPPNDDV